MAVQEIERFGAHKVSASCTAGCPRGYSGCCGTSRASCCLRQQCPNGMQSTGQRCSSDCGVAAQLCVSGICCSPTSSSSSSSPQSITIAFQATCTVTAFSSFSPSDTCFQHSLYPLNSHQSLQPCVVWCASF